MSLLFPGSTRNSRGPGKEDSFCIDSVLVPGKGWRHFLSTVHRPAAFDGLGACLKSRCEAESNRIRVSLPRSAGDLGAHRTPNHCLACEHGAYGKSLFPSELVSNLFGHLLKEPAQRVLEGLVFP